MTSYEVKENMCGTCEHFEPNGTRFGGKCQNEKSEMHRITVSVLKDDMVCHSSMEQSNDG